VNSFLFLEYHISWFFLSIVTPKWQEKLWVNIKTMKSTDTWQSVYQLTICLSTDNLFINKKKLITTNINKTIVFLENDSVSDCCLMPIQQFFSYIMTRTSLFSMRWWWGPLCTRPTHWVVFFIVLAHWNNSVAPLGHIILIPSQPVFALSP
jgi:hypothetical protein